MKHRIGTLAALACAAMIATTASGAIIIQTQPFSGVPNYGTALTFNQYNGLLADLISVKVELYIQTSGGSLTVDNDGVTGANVTVALGAAGAITSGDVSLLNGSFAPVVGTVAASTGNVFNLAGNVGDGPGDYNGSPPDGAVHVGGNASNSAMGFIHMMFHPGYVGAGTYEINANVTQILNFGSVGGVEGAFSPVTGSGYVRVTYEDDIIPEPATIALLGLGGLVMLRRKRR